MKSIEIDEELYQYIAGQTKYIGEDASSILRRLLNFKTPTQITPIPVEKPYVSPNYSVFIDLLESDSFLSERSIVRRFMQILSTLYEYNPSLFSIAASLLHGRKRQYLSQDRISLETSGKNTKPREIVGTSYWVITNTNTARKVYIIEAIMSNMGISADLINIVTDAFVKSVNIAPYNTDYFLKKKS